MQFNVKVNAKSVDRVKFISYTSPHKSKTTSKGENVNSLDAFKKGEQNRGRELNVFDWDKAAQIINEKGALYASAGLSGDWEWTGGEILKGGSPVPANETYTYLASTWATPELDICDEIIPCFKMKSDTPGWDASTYWPDSSLEKLIDNAENKGTRK